MSMSNVDGLLNFIMVINNLGVNYTSKELKKIKRQIHKLKNRAIYIFKLIRDKFQILNSYSCMSLYI